MLLALRYFGVCVMQRCSAGGSSPAEARARFASSRCVCACVSVRAHALARTHSHTNSRAHACAHKHKRAHTRTQTHTHTRRDGCARPQMRTWTGSSTRSMPFSRGGLLPACVRVRACVFVCVRVVVVCDTRVSRIPYITTLIP